MVDYLFKLIRMYKSVYNRNIEEMIECLTSDLDLLIIYYISESFHFIFQLSKELFPGLFLGSSWRLATGSLCVQIICLLWFSGRNFIIY